MTERRRGTRGRAQRTMAAMVVAGLLAAAPLAAQVCLGHPAASTGWLALEIGRAAKDANVRGVDAGYRLSRRLTLFADARLTVYPRPDPERERLAMGAALTLVRSSRFAACLTPGIEGERISDLGVLRVPVGLAVGWTSTADTGRRRLGLRVEPFFVYSRETIAQFSHTSSYLSVRAAVVYGVRRWFVGIEHEWSRDDDARWHTLGRIGYAFR